MKRSVCSFSEIEPAWTPSVAYVHAVLRSALTGEPVRAVWNPPTLPETYADAPIDPEAVTAYSRRQGVVASVYRRLCEMDDPPAAVPEALRSVAQSGSGTALLQAEELRAILRAFDREDIPVIVLKGLHLDVNLYGGPGRRKNGDHDLLVRPDRIWDAVRVLNEMGFTDPTARAGDDKASADAKEAGNEEAVPHHAPPLVRREPGRPPVMVELHWALSPSSPTLPLHGAVDWTEAAWERAGSSSLLDEPVQRMDPADEVLYLALHLARHLTYYDAQVMPRLSMIEDLARVMSAHPKLRGSVLRERGEALGPVFIFGPVEFLARSALGMDLGLSVEDAWPSGWLSRWSVSAPRILQNDRRSSHRRRLDQMMAHAAILKRPRDRRRVWRRGFRQTPAHAPVQVEAGGPSTVTRGLQLGWRILAGR